MPLESVPTVTAESNGKGAAPAPDFCCAAATEGAPAKKVASIATPKRTAKGNLIPDLICFTVNGWRPDASGRFNVISFRNRVEKACTVPLELHWTDSANILKCRQRSGTPQRELGQGTIREYNIRGHMFLAGDRAPDGFEHAEQTFFGGAERDIICNISNMRRGAPRLPVATHRTWRVVFHGRDRGDAEAVVAARASRFGRRITEVTQHEPAPALPGVRVLLHRLKL